MTSKRLLAFAVIAAAAVGVARVADVFGGLTGVRDLELRTLDWRQTTTAESFQAGIGERESDIVLVLFDSLSVEEWPYLVPFPRTVLAELIDAVSMAGARTIGLDVYLDRLYRATPEQAAADTLLRDAMARAGNVILVGPVIQTDSGPVVGQPHPFFADVSLDVGTAELPSAFETFRDGTLAVRTRGGLEPSFALALYGHATGVDPDSLLRASRAAGHITLPGLPPQVGKIPREWREASARAASVIMPFTLRYVGPPSSSDAAAPPGTFQAFSATTTPITAMLSPEFFQDKIVLMGTGFHNEDKFRTPFFGVTAPADTSAGREAHPYGWMYGVEIHANALQNMLDGEYVRPMRMSIELLLMLLLAALSAAVAFRKGATWGGAATLLLMGSIVVLAFWLWAGKAYGPGGTYFQFHARFLAMPIVTPSLSALLAYVGAVGYVSVVEGKEKRFIKSAFGKYVSPEVVAEIAEHPETLQLGGQKRHLSILFSDLAGFTTLSERMDPQDLLSHLNEYLSDMTRIVMDEQGTLDKYIGDAIMAFWNAPREVPDHADRALRTAVLMQRRMEELNTHWRETDPDAEPLVVRIGINTGTVVVGNVGGKERFDYSAIGDAVNLAARLEPANKSYDTLVMASEFTLEEADARAFRTRELDLIAVKGKVEPVKVYEVMEMAGVALPPEKEEALAFYEKGLEAYRNRDWALALQYFRAACEADPTDGPSAVYRRRAEEYVAEPPPADWDFVVRRTVK
ncbi:MAG: CHASE2 domain-containing protein [Gemmatimonadota bacterium]